MRKTAMVFLVAMLATLAAGGTALAADRIECRDRPDGRCTGTERDDALFGTREAETIRGLGGSDSIRGGGGSDTLVGGDGGDRIVASRCPPSPGTRVLGASGDDEITVANDCGNLAVVAPPDEVDCGPGRDAVSGVAPGDRIAANCERVVRG